MDWDSLVSEAQRQAALELPGAALFHPGMGRQETGRRRGSLPVPPNPLHWSAIADRRLRRRVHVPASQSDGWLDLVEQAIG